MLRPARKISLRLVDWRLERTYSSLSGRILCTLCNLSGYVACALRDLCGRVTGYVGALPDCIACALYSLASRVACTLRGALCTRSHVLSRLLATFRNTLSLPRSRVLPQTSALEDARIHEAAHTIVSLAVLLAPCAVFRSSFMASAYHDGQDVPYLRSQ